MKALNYIMSACFGVTGVVCFLTALSTGRFELYCLGGFCTILAYLAWQDYKENCNDDNTIL